MRTLVLLLVLCSIVGGCASRHPVTTVAPGGARTVALTAHDFDRLAPMSGPKVWAPMDAALLPGPGADQAPALDFSVPMGQYDRATGTIYLVCWRPDAPDAAELGRLRVLEAVRVAAGK